MERSSCGQFEALSQLYNGGTDENHEVFWDNNSLGKDLNSGTLEHKALLLNTGLWSLTSPKECISSYFVYITIILLFTTSFGPFVSNIREKTHAKVV